MRSDAVFKRTYNSVLDRMATMAIGDSLDSEHTMARDFKVSRTTVRKILDALTRHGLVNIGVDGNRTIARLPKRGESFPEEETAAGRETVERGFMELIQAEIIRPGEVISTADLARRLRVSATVIREYLEGFRQFGLIARQENGTWVFAGFDQNFARELSDIRELIEVRAAEAFGDLPLDHPAWKELDDIEQRHIELQANFQRDSELFSRLDEEFHLLINSVLKNRFVNNFNHVRSFIFHYHYQWNKSDEKERNSVAIAEHLDYIRALKSRDRMLIRLAANRHLQSARISLLASMR
ncbi:Transcriptional regulator, GntR family [uncultured Pleomorphomonas sp.]|uniref:Transcriptional regulator, GntR family n=1 Tax=uncultured Pleomorphomonas sp. TaxID=442121 RepID=A0A212LGZ8_9HYPH|nr:FCD domain-containing protein [uncultured Pleomorphomonas sp.]SCM76824.1 Transcriptional regulator, GntR family [uncultured Pleomorphomonas sp.]